MENVLNITVTGELWGVRYERYLAKPIELPKLMETLSRILQ